MKFKIVYFLLAAVVLTAGCKLFNKPVESEDANANTDSLMTEEIQESQAPDPWTLIDAKEPILRIVTTDGTMTVKLYSETPLHRNNFVKLAKSGFYNDIVFHRIIRDFMIQVGDPNTKNPAKASEVGKGGPGYTIPAEIVSGKTHKRGALAAARRGDAVNPAKESSGSQFYIVHSAENCSHLNGEYTIFGEVLEGMGVVDRIAAEPVNQNDYPINPVKIISIEPVVEVD